MHFSYILLVFLFTCHAKRVKRQQQQRRRQRSLQDSSSCNADNDCTLLVFSTAGSGLQDTEMAIWNAEGQLLAENDDFGDNNSGWSQVMIPLRTRPVTYYVGGGPFVTYFYPNFAMNGNSDNVQGSITFSVNNITIGTTDLHATNQFALYRIDVDEAGSLATQPVPPSIPPNCSVADYLDTKKQGCTLDVVCSLMDGQLSSDGVFNCGLNDDNDLVVELVFDTECYTNEDSFVLGDLTQVPEGATCVTVTSREVFDSSGQFIQSTLETNVEFSSGRTHVLKQDYSPVSCDYEHVFEYLTLGDTTYCYATDDCSSISLDNQACTGTCAACGGNDQDNYVDCSNLDASLVQSCVDFDMVEPLVAYLQNLPTPSPVDSPVPLEVPVNEPVEAPSSMDAAPVDTPMEAPMDEVPMDAPVEAPVDPPLNEVPEDPPVEPPVEPPATSHAAGKSTIIICLLLWILWN